MGGIGLPSFAQSPLISNLYGDLVDTDKVLVLVYLGGGNDGLNTVVPMHDYATLTAARPDLILPESSLLGLSDTSDFKLHPSLTSFRNLYDDGKLGIVHGVGYPNQDFSHFRSTDIWMTAADNDQILSTGWLGRYLNEEYPNYPVEYPNASVPDPLAIEIGYNLSIAFQGPITGMGMVVADPEWFYQLVNNEEEPNVPGKAGDKLDYIRLITKQSQVYGEVIREAAGKVQQQATYPESELAEQLKIVARLIAGGLQTRLYMVSLHGFDTHDSQVVPSDHLRGEHATLLETLGSSVEAFIKDLRYLGIQDRVLGATVSEFGRRIISNASNGTDHGAAAPLFVFGEHVRGGLYGQSPEIPDNPSVEDNLPMTTDFRSIYTSILQDWFCVEGTHLQATFGQDFPTIPFVANSPCVSTSTHLLHEKAGLSLIRGFPNPFQDTTTIEFESNGGPLQISISDLAGRTLQVLASGTFATGTHRITWHAGHLPPGTYHATYRDRTYQQSKSLIKR